MTWARIRKMGENYGKAKPGSKRRDDMDECELMDRREW